MSNPLTNDFLIPSNWHSPDWNSPEKTVTDSSAQGGPSNTAQDLSGPFAAVTPEPGAFAWGLPSLNNEKENVVPGEKENVVPGKNGFLPLTPLKPLTKGLTNRNLTHLTYTEHDSSWPYTKPPEEADRTPIERQLYELINRPSYLLGPTPRDVSIIGKRALTLAKDRSREARLKSRVRRQPARAAKDDGWIKGPVRFRNQKSTNKKSNKETETNVKPPKKKQKINEAKTLLLEIF